MDLSEEASYKILKALDDYVEGSITADQGMADILDALVDEVPMNEVRILLRKDK